jgi:hypothetical protein
MTGEFLLAVGEGYEGEEKAREKGRYREKGR